MCFCYAKTPPSGSQFRMKAALSVPDCSHPPAHLVRRRCPSPSTLSAHGVIAPPGPAIRGVCLPLNPAPASRPRCRVRSVPAPDNPGQRQSSPSLHSARSGPPLHCGQGVPWTRSALRGRVLWAVKGRREMRGPAQKTGRPVKQPNERRCSQMNIRLTLAEAEYIRVQAASAGLTEA